MACCPVCRHGAHHDPIWMIDTCPALDNQWRTDPDEQMVLRLPPLSWLRAFEASARHLSFTLAAAELNLTQSAVSKQVKLLESQLGEALFERKARSLILTKAGASYLPKIQDGFERLADGTLEVFGNRRSEILTLRAPIGFAVNWLAPRMPGFLDRFPTVPVRLVTSVWSGDSEAERVDLDIRYGHGQWTGCRADRLCWDRMTPLCAPGVAARLTRPDDLAGERLLHVLGFQEGWPTWLAAAGAARVDPGAGLHFDTSLMALEVAAAAGGVTLGRSSMAAPLVAAGRLVRPFALELPAREAFFLISWPDRIEHPHLPQFRDWLLAEAEAERVAKAGFGPRGGINLPRAVPEAG